MKSWRLKSWRQAPWRELALSAAAILLTLIVIDRALCLVYPAFKINAGAVIEDPELGWKLRPNIRRVYSGMSHNRLGYRGREVGGERPLATFIGDSVTYGATSDENTFPALFEQLTGWAAGNFGVPGYGPTHYEKVLAKASALEPDLMIVGFFVGNDVPDCWEGRTRDVGSRPGEPARWGWSGIYRLLLFRGLLELPGWGQREEIWAATMDEDRFMKMEWHRAAVYRRGALGKRWGCVEATLRRMVPHDPLVLVLPDEMQVDDQLWDKVLSRADRPEAFDRDLPNERLRNLAEGLGLRSIDVTPQLRAERRRTFFPWDSHPNPLGNAIVAGVLAEEVNSGRYEVRLPAPRHEEALEKYSRSFSPTAELQGPLGRQIDR